MEPDATAEPLPSWRPRLTWIFLGVVAAGLLAAGVVGADQPPPTTHPPIFAETPEATAILFDGTEWSLAEHIETDDRPVVLNLWASWCPPCLAEIPAISAFAREHPDVYVIGIAVDDTEEAARALADQLRPSYPVGIDPTGTLSRRWPSLGLPVTFIIDRDGLVRTRLDGLVDEARLESALG